MTAAALFVSSFVAMKLYRDQHGNGENGYEN